MEIKGQIYLDTFIEDSDIKFRTYENELKLRLSKYMDLSTNEIIVDYVSEEVLAEMIYLLKELGYNAQERTPILRRILQKNSSSEKRNK